MTDARRAAPLMLTVVIADATPIRYLNEPATHRTVHVRLTPGQCDAIAFHTEDESYSLAYVEPMAHAEVICER